MSELFVRKKIKMADYYDNHFEYDMMIPKSWYKETDGCANPLSLVLDTEYINRRINRYKNEKERTKTRRERSLCK